MRKLLASLTAIALVIIGCKTLNPGADPFVVRVEQTETVAKGAFDFVLNVDNSQRQFWMTNAPAFHTFCESLRVPQAVGTNMLPRCSAIFLIVDTVKNDYEASRSSSNDLWSVFTTLTTILSQAQGWQSVITNTIH